MGALEIQVLEPSALLRRGLARAVDWLLGQQQPDGYWVGALESNASMEAEWLLAMHFLGVDDDPKYPGVVRAILHSQRADGSWEVFHDAPNGDLSVTVECYAALRCAGLDPDSDPLRRAREWLLRRDLGDVRVFTRIWLALIGEWPWESIPNIVPEMIYLPAPWCPFNIYQFSSWARGTLVPLMVLSARRPVRPLPPGRRLDELHPNGREATDYRIRRSSHWFTTEGLFHALDRAAGWYRRRRWHPFRERAIRLCLEWIIRHQEADGAWSGIQPPWIYALMALNVEGYALDHPVVARGLRAFDPPWAYERHGATWLQASNSPIWDTVLALLGLLESGHAPDQPAVDQAIDWLLDEQVDAPGDWQVVVRRAPSGGWAFEYENDAYPDCDDTAVALQVLAKLGGDRRAEPRVQGAIERATAWLEAMQSSCGGWAAFDKDNDHFLVSRIPFCDFGEALDPPSVDVTAHVIEALGLLGRDRHDPTVARGLAFIRAEQEPEGSWFGRWGVNHIYGTAAVLPALRAVGENMLAPYVRKAADWLVLHQNADGGWGETCASYMDDALRGRGPSTASQTGWALLGLIAVGSPRYEQSLRAGVDYLLRTQRDDGTWDEPQYTGTGFPGYGIGRRTERRQRAKLPQGTELSRGFMINYNLYRHYFPLLALARAAEALPAAGAPAWSGRTVALAEPPRLRERLATVESTFDTAALLDRPHDVQEVIGYYTQSAFAWQLWHSRAGAVHMAINYDGEYHPEGHLEQARIVQRQMAAVGAGRVLELASGKGYNSSYLAAQHPEVEFRGVDVTPLHVRMARRKGRRQANLRFERADFQQLPHPDESFDLVFVVEGLCHAFDVAGALREVHRVLRPGGRFVVMEPFRRPGFELARPSVQYAARLVEASFAIDSFPAVDAWLELARETGFAVLETEDHTAAVMPNLRELHARAMWWRRLTWGSARLRRLMPFLMRNAVACLLMPETFGPDCRAHCYELIALAKPIDG